VKGKDQADNEDQSPATRSFLVNAIIPDITLTPTSIDFGAIALGKSSANQTMTVKNDGTVTLNLGAVGVGGTNANQFSKAADNCSKKNLAPGASCTVAARFTPTSNGAKTGTLIIPSNDPDENPFNVALSGTGGAGSGTPDVTVTPLSINFGNVKVKKLVEQTITVKNDGTADLTLPAITVGGTHADQFDTGADKCSKKTLAANASCTVNTKFKATSTGAKTATLIIPSNDPDENPVSVSLSGTGTP
jgi:hypothetical protein